MSVRDLNPASASRSESTIRRPSKAGHVYESIKEAILSGELAPGSAIDKAALCESLGMSRFPVTAAINRLAFEKLVVIEPQHGSFVSRISLADCREFMLIRRAIEGDIAAEAAKRGGSELSDKLERNLRYQATAADARDYSGFYALDVEFHRTIVQGLGLKHAAEVLDRLLWHLERVRRLLMTPPGRTQQSLDEHRAIAKAIADGDAGVAAIAARAHLEKTTTVFDTFARQHPRLFADATP